MFSTPGGGGGEAWCVGRSQQGIVLLGLKVWWRFKRSTQTLHTLSCQNKRRTGSGRKVMKALEILLAWWLVGPVDGSERPSEV